MVVVKSPLLPLKKSLMFSQLVLSDLLYGSTLSLAKTILESNPQLLWPRILPVQALLQ